MASPWWLDSILQPFKWNSQNTHAHSGVDVSMPSGTDIVSPVAGTVQNAGPKPWGTQVDIQVGPGDMPPSYDQSETHVVSFLHMQRADVNPGDEVGPGQHIGLSGKAPPGYYKGPPSAANHTHVEVTAGSTPPYQGKYSPWHPTRFSYPQDAQPLLDYVSQYGAQSGKGGGLAKQDTSQQQGSDFWSQFWQGVFGGIPIIGGGLQQSGIASNMGAQFSNLFSWITSPIRVLKMLAGLGLIAGALLLAFLPNAAAVGVAAAGAPEAAPAVRSALSGKRGNPAQGAARAGSSAYVRSKARQKKQASAKAAPASQSRDSGQAPPAAKEEDGGEPVYYGGKRVGTSKGGKVTLDKKAEAKSA